MKKFSLLFFLFLLGQQAFSQGVGINNDSSPPDSSAMLDVKSTAKGILIPRMTTAEKADIPTPATGLMVFDNTTLSFWYYNGTAWVEIGADHLGNHTATTNIQTAGNYISNDGDNEGIFVDTNGKVGVGTNNPSTLIEAQSSAST
ncbi:MAG: hypothetical protein AAF985_21170, partial [Bacteroidota bacterium]